MAAGYDGSIKFDTSISPAGFNKGIKNLFASMKGALGLLGIAFGITALISFGKQAIQLGAALRAVRIRAVAVFGNSVKEVTANMELLGQSTNNCGDDLLELATSFQIAFSAMGFGSAKAEDMSEQLTKLSLDMAAFYGKDKVEVAHALRLATMGLTRGLREYGIVLDQNTIKAKAYEMKLYSGTGALSQQAKAQAILQLITERTTASQDYAAKTANTYMGRIRGIKVAIEDVSENVGIGLMTALGGLLPFIRIFVDWLVRLSQAFMTLMGVIFGVRTPIVASSTALEDSASAAGDLEDGMAGAGKAAKGALAAFDQINVLQQEDGGGAGMKALPAIPAMPAIDFEQTEGTFQKWWATFKETWKTNWENLKLIVKTIWDEIIRAFSTGDFSTIKEWLGLLWNWFVTEFLPTVGGFMANLLTIAAQYIYAFVQNSIIVIRWAWENLKIIIGAIVSAILQKIIDTWLLIVAWVQTNVIDPLKLAWETGLDAIKTKWQTIWDGIKLLVKNTVNTIIGFINTMISAIATGINTVISGLNKIKVTIPKWVPGIGGNIWSLNIPSVSAPKIPMLATGAVIPPNSQFAAILGDQSKGTNIEAPEQLIRQIINEEIGNISADIKISFEGSLGALVRELKPVIDRENIRVGGSLVQGSKV
jgi:hypothetical protein